MERGLRRRFEAPTVAGLALGVSGASPSEAPIAGRAVAMIVESRLCMNKAHETINEITSRLVCGVIGFGENTPAI